VILVIETLHYLPSLSTTFDVNTLKNCIPLIEIALP